MGNSHRHQLITWHPGDILSIINDASALRRDHTSDRLKGGSLSCAVSADQRDDLSLVYFKGDTLQRLDHAVIHLQILYFQNCCHLYSPPTLQGMR